MGLDIYLAVSLVLEMPGASADQSLQILFFTYELLLPCSHIGNVMYNTLQNIQTNNLNRNDMLQVKALADISVIILCKSYLLPC